MKPHIIRMIAALLLGCALCPGRSLGQEYVKTSVRPFEFRELTELYGDKVWEKRMSRTKKENKYQEVKPVMLPDGTPGMLCYHKKSKYSTTPMFNLCDSVGYDKYGRLRVDGVNIQTIDGKDYVQFVESGLAPKYILCEPEGKRLYYKASDYKVIRAGGHTLLWIQNDNVIVNMDGKTILYGGSHISNVSIHYSPEVKPEIKSVVVDGQSIDMLCSATPEFLYMNATYNGTAIDYKETADFQGNKLFKQGGWNMIPFPCEGTGYYLQYAEIPSFEIKQVNREVGGEVIPYRRLSLKDEENSCSLLNSREGIGKKLSGIVYSSPDHSIIYRTYEGGRYLKGGVFLRDTTLNVPPLFADVMYKFDEEAQAWKPYVRRTMFGPSEPYTAGMDTTPDYLNEAERRIERGGLYMYELDKYYGKDHKWSARDLAYVDYLATRKVRGWQTTYEYYPEAKTWYKRSLSDLADLGKRFLEACKNNAYDYDYRYACQIYEQAKTNYDGEEVPALAEQLIALTETKMQEMHEWINRQTEIYNLVFEQNDKAKEREERLAAIRESQMAMERQAAAARRKSQATDNATSLLILNAVMRGVSNTLSNIRGGNRLRVTYTGGNNGGFTAAPVGGGSGGTSAGSPVNAAEKCGRCGGTGSCSACHGHPGKATSAKDSPVCHGCGGTGRCPYCTNGYKR